MARMVEIRALKRFRGPCSRQVMPGETCTAQENFCAAKVRLGEAIYVGGKAPTPIGFTQSGPKVARRVLTKEAPSPKIDLAQQTADKLKEQPAVKDKIAKDRAREIEAELLRYTKPELLEILSHMGGAKGLNMRSSIAALRSACRAAALKHREELGLDDPYEPIDLDDDSDIEDED